MNLKSIPVDRLMGLRDRVDAALSATAADPPRKVIKRTGGDQRNHSTQRGRFDDFCHANDPHQEHDFGSFKAEADGSYAPFHWNSSLLSQDVEIPMCCGP
jgi:hypothetical protein